MIINGNSRSNAKFFTKHLLNAEQNERVEVKEIRGFVAENVPDAFKEIEIIGSATRARNSFYHSNINPDEGEKLTPEQWAQTIETLEQKLGLEGQPRFVIAHEKKNREHIHVVWSRIDSDTMTAIPMENNYLAHTETARELERMFGHEPTPVPPHPERDRFKDWETFRAQESGLDPKLIKAQVTALFQSSDSGAAFQSALEASGFTLCRGDKQGVLCIVDSYGDSHALLRRLDGIRAAELRAFMADLDPQVLPSVAEAIQLVKAQPESEGGDSAARVLPEEQRKHDLDYAASYMQQYGHTGWEFPEHRGRNKQIFHDQWAEEEGSTGGATPLVTEEQAQLGDTNPKLRVLNHMAEEQRAQESLDPRAAWFVENLPETYPVSTTARDHAELMETDMRANDCELPFTHGRTWEMWADHAMQYLRERAGSLSEKVQETTHELADKLDHVKEKLSTFWQDFIKEGREREPPEIQEPELER